MAEWLKVLNDATVLMLLGIAIYGLMRRWWVPGWVYDESEKRADEWKELALKGTQAAETAVNLAARTTRTRRE